MFISLPFSAWLAEAYGARVPTVSCALFIVTCTMLRAVPAAYRAAFGYDMSTEAIFWINIASMVFNGLAAAWLNFAGAALSELWFDESRRGVVTATISVMPYVGVALGFILGPNLLRVPVGKAGQDSMEQLIFWCAGIGALVAVAIIAHFPAAPPAPASQSAGHRNTVIELHTPERGSSWKAAISALIRATCDIKLRAVTALWIINVTFGIPFGIYGGWQAILGMSLKRLAGFSTNQAGWIGFWMQISGCLGGVVVGAANDRFAGQLMSWIVCLWMLASVGLAVFCTRVLELWQAESEHVDQLLIYLSAVAGGFFFNAPLPLFFELVSRCAVSPRLGFAVVIG